MGCGQQNCFGPGNDCHNQNEGWHEISTFHEIAVFVCIMERTLNCLAISYLALFYKKCYRSMMLYFVDDVVYEVHSRWRHICSVCNSLHPMNYPYAKYSPHKPTAFISYQSEYCPLINIGEFITYTFSLIRDFFLNIFGPPFKPNAAFNKPWN